MLNPNALMTDIPAHTVVILISSRLQHTVFTSYSPNGFPGPAFLDPPPPPPVFFTDAGRDFVALLVPANPNGFPAVATLGPPTPT